MDCLEMHYLNKLDLDYLTSLLLNTNSHYVYWIIRLTHYKNTSTEFFCTEKSTYLQFNRERKKKPSVVISAPRRDKVIIHQCDCASKKNHINERDTRVLLPATWFCFSHLRSPALSEKIYTSELNTRGGVHLEPLICRAIKLPSTRMQMRGLICV